MDPIISGLNRSKRKYGPVLAAIAALYVTTQNVLLLSFLSRNVKNYFINCDSRSILENVRLVIDEFQKFGDLLGMQMIFSTTYAPLSTSLMRSMTLTMLTTLTTLNTLL